MIEPLLLFIFIAVLVFILSNHRRDDTRLYDTYTIDTPCTRSTDYTFEEETNQWKAISRSHIPKRYVTKREYYDDICTSSYFVKCPIDLNNGFQGVLFGYKIIIRK